MTVQERNLLGSILETATLPPDTTFDELTDLFKGLRQVEDSSKWAIGDALIAAERLFGDGVYQAAEATGLSPKTLAKYRWVASHWPRDERRLDGDYVTFSHHEIVASLPVEIRCGWLDEAEAKRWRTAELRAHVRPDKPELVCTCVVDPECPKHGS